MSIFKEQPARDKQIKLFVSEDERVAIQSLAESHDISVSELLRRAVNEYARLHGDGKKNRRKS